MIAIEIADFLLWACAWYYKYFMAKADRRLGIGVGQRVFWYTVGLPVIFGMWLSRTLVVHHHFGQAIEEQDSSHSSSIQDGPP